MCFIGISYLLVVVLFINRLLGSYSLPIYSELQTDWHASVIESRCSSSQKKCISRPLFIAGNRKMKMESVIDTKRYVTDLRQWRIFSKRRFNHLKSNSIQTRIKSNFS